MLISPPVKTGGLCCYLPGREVYPVIIRGAQLREQKPHMSVGGADFLIINLLMRSQETPHHWTIRRGAALRTEGQPPVVIIFIIFNSGLQIKE